MKKALYFFIIIFAAIGCYEPQRECEPFKNGRFRFTTILNNQEITTTFTRQGSLEIEFFNDKTDSSSVRWLNNCEYILKKLHPKNKAEEKSVHIKIISTTDSTYTFTYGLVGQTQKSKGTAFKIK